MSGSLSKSKRGSMEWCSGEAVEALVGLGWVLDQVSRDNVDDRSAETMSVGQVKGGALNAGCCRTCGGYIRNGGSLLVVELARGALELLQG